MTVRIPIQWFVRCCLFEFYRLQFTRSPSTNISPNLYPKKCKAHWEFDGFVYISIQGMSFLSKSTIGQCSIADMCACCSIELKSICEISISTCESVCIITIIIMCFSFSFFLALVALFFSMQNRYI